MMGDVREERPLKKYGGCWGAPWSLIEREAEEGALLKHLEEGHRRYHIRSTYRTYDSQNDVVVVVSLSHTT